MIASNSNFGIQVHWQGPQQNGIDQREDGGVRADTERERRHRDGGEAWLFRQHSQGVSQILQQHSQRSNPGPDSCHWINQRVGLSNSR